MLVPPSTPSCVLQPRDLTVLTQLSRFGCLTSHQIHQLVFPRAAPQVCRRRLRCLSTLGLVAHYRLPRSLVALPTSHAVYVLTAAGARRVTPHIRVRPIALGTLLHDVGTNNVLLKLAADLGASITPEPMLRRALARARREGQVPAQMCVPDGVLELPSGAVYLEFMRTAPRGGLTSAIAKCQRYVHFARAGVFRRVYGHERVRAVLMLTPQPGRTAQLLARATTLGRGTGLFLFGTTTTAGDPPAEWRRPGGEPCPLPSLLA